MRDPSRALRTLAGVALLLAAGYAGQAPGAEEARSVTLSAQDALEKAQELSGVARNLKGEGVILYEHVLIEDDGPSISSGNYANYTKKIWDQMSPLLKVEGAARAKKVLHVERPEALEARLYVPRGIKVELNGKFVETPDDSKYPAVPVELLKKGDNELVLYASEGKSYSLKIAKRANLLQDAPERKDNPPRSFKSADGGKTWKEIDGELMVRLHLIQSPAEGYFVSPVIDTAAEGEQAAVAPAWLSVESARIRHRAETPAGTSLEFAVRTGSSPTYEKKLWGDWQPPGSALPAGYRFLQWKAVLTTTDGRVTPVLKSLTVEAELAGTAPPAWAGKVKLKGARNEELLYSSMPFAYEDPSHPKLKLLRQKYKLDEVVKDGKTEFEKQVALRNWVSKQWKYNPPAEYYPAWDAHDILQHKIGFCVQYAIVYIQCCSALGWQARFTFGNHPGIPGSGHEVTEVWSNQYRKWVFMDPNGNRHHLDPKTKVPLSMLEIHDRLVRAYYEGGKADWRKRPRKPRGSEEIATCRGSRLEPSRPHDGDIKKWPPWRKWLYFRYVPRNDFYTRPRPLPRIQGWNWDWTGFWTWNGRELFPEYKYRHLSGRRADFYWTLNQVRFAASYGSARGTIYIQMGTHAPGFDTFLVNVDGKGWRKSGREFKWKLHTGTNRLEMRTRNRRGVEGPVSFVELDC